MPLNKLENFIKNYEGRILYVNPNDLDSTDSITNQGNSLTKPFKTIQRALIEAARFSFVTGNDNDRNDRTTILVFPAEHVIDNRPGYGIRKTGTALAEVVTPSGQVISPASDAFNLNLESNFDITQEDNILYKFNSIHGGVILPRGTSLVGLDLRKTKIRPKYVPNPTDPDVPSTSIFKITGNCYFWQFSLFDANENELVYTNNKIFTSGSGNLSLPTFSHHKLTCFEYCDGVNVPTGYDITDLDMYYAKLSQAFNEGSGRQIPASQKFPLSPKAFAKERPEWEIVGAFGTDPVDIESIISGDGATPGPIVTVKTVEEHGLTAGTPIKIRGVNVNDYNVSTVVQSVIDTKSFTYLLGTVRNDLDANPAGSATVTIETDTVKGASPYIFNCSLRSVWGMNGMKADGSKASGFKSMVVAQFTAVSLQKDDRAFVKYDPVTRTYNGIQVPKTYGSQLSSQSASTVTSQVYHLDSDAIYRPGWEPSHIKIINDAFIQIVSVFAIGFNKHFDAQSGGDGSITNSNSNFGQFSLASEGFKKEAFRKDDHGFITSIITPKHIPTTEQDIDWISIDVSKTINVGISSHLYLFGFNTQDNVPPNLIQGYRIGARKNDTLYLRLPNSQIVSGEILMTDNVINSTTGSATGTNSSVKEYTVSSTTSAPNYDTLSLSSSHKLQTGEKILILSDTGDLPENLTENKIYFAIRVSDTQIKIASSFTNAQNGLGIRMYGGTKLRILSRVSDRDSGELGSPIQYDPNNSGWFVYVNAANTIYPEIVSRGVAGFDEPRTDVTFVKRIEDSRSLDEKIYKVRVVIPKESVNAKNPADGFVLQESSSTGPENDSEYSLSNITVQNYNYKRNPRFISTCSVSSGTVTVVTELPHNLTTGDRVLIKNVRSSTNPLGIGNTAYNGDFTATVLDNVTFTYSTTDSEGTVHNVGIFSGVNVKNTTSPRFERNDLQSNFYIYRNEVISPYIYNVQDGIYHLYVLKSDNAIPDTFTNYKYSQSIVDLYPQKDPDNIDDNPNAASSFAKRAPLGEVVTNDLKKSVTRETLDALVKKFGVTPIIQSVTPISGGISTITTTLPHGLNGIIGFSNYTSGTGYSNGTYYNVKLVNLDNSWNGATANIVVSGTASSITSIQILNNGAGYGSTTLSIEGFAGATVEISETSISSAVNNSIQVTGLGTASDGLFRIVSIPSGNKIAIARTSGDPSISPGQYTLNVGPSILVNNVTYTSSSGIATIVTSNSHGLVAGNKFRIVDSDNNNLGDFIINDTVGINTIIFRSTKNPTGSHRILKHGFSANDLVSEAGTENLGARGVSFYANETAILLENVGTDSVVGVSTFPIQVSNSGISTTSRFPLGSYIQINNEIMRIASSTLSGSGNNKITVLRGVLGTQKESHQNGSLIKRIKPLPIEFRRPSILRASGHTFEYLGYGPGNYSTGLPQIQTRTLTERADFLSQSQEKSCGSVVYTGMNSDGDFFIGNTKYSSASGQQTTFDIPISTVTGQDPSRLSAVFDEIIVKERILVEGGKSKKVLSQFDGPVTFNENIIVNNEQTKINGQLITSNLIVQKNDTDSTALNNGSIVTRGGAAVAKNLNVGGNVSIAGTTTFNGEVQFNSGLVPDSFEDAYIGSTAKPWSEAHIGNIQIAVGGSSAENSDAADRTITTSQGDLILNSQSGTTSILDDVEIDEDLLVRGNARVVGLTTFQSNTRHEDNDKALFGDGGDLEIFHDGSNSFIKDTGTGSLIVTTNNLQVKNAANSETGLTFTEDGSVELYFNNSRKLETTNDGLNATGIVTASNGFFPLADSGAPLGSLALSFSDLFVDNLRLDGNVLSSTNTNGNITLTPNGTGIVETVNDVNFGTVVDESILTVVGQLNADNLRIDGNTVTSTNTNGNIVLDANGTGIIDINSPIDVEGTSILQGDVTVHANIVPNTDITSTLGSITGSNRRFAAAYIGNLLLADGATGNSDNTITTSAGNLVLDSFTNNVDVTANLNVSENATVTGTLQVNTAIIPDVDGAPLGNTTNRFTEAFIGDLVLAEGATNNRINTSAGDLLLNAASNIVTEKDLAVGGATARNLSVTGTSTLTGAVTLGGNIVPTSNVSSALGTAAAPFTEAYIGDIRIALGDNNRSIVTGEGTLNLGTANFDTTIAGNLRVSGTSIVGDLSTNTLTVNTAIIPDADGANIGSAERRFSEAFIGNIRLNGNTISATTGNLELNPTGGEVRILQSLNVSQASVFEGTTSFRNTMTLGGPGETVNLILRDAVDGTPKITLNSKNGNINSDGNIDISGGQLTARTIQCNLGGTFGSITSGNINAGGSTINAGKFQGGDFDGGDVTCNTIRCRSNLNAADADVTLGSSGKTINVNGNSNFNGTVRVNNTFIAAGAIDLGDAASDIVTILGTARFRADATFNGNTSFNGLRNIFGSSVNSVHSFIGPVSFEHTINVRGSSNIDIIGSGRFIGRLDRTLSFRNSFGDTLGSFNNTADVQITLPQPGTMLSGTEVASPSSWAYLGQRSTLNFARNSISNTLVFRDENSDAFFRRVVCTDDVIAFSGFSDDRLKTNKKPILNSLEKVSQLNTFTFDWNDKAKEIGVNTDQRQVGISAQELEKVLPEALKSIKVRDEEFLMVNYEKIVPLLIESIKDLKAEIDELKKSK